MRFKLEVELGNDAMQSGLDVGRLLVQASMVVQLSKLEPGAGKPLLDVNGNKVGSWEVTEDE